MREGKSNLDRQIRGGKGETNKRGKERQIKDGKGREIREGKAIERNK